MARTQVARVDIARVACDVVIVSANTFLDLEGGAARALVPSIISAAEVEAVFAPRRSTAKVGDIIVTSSGRHPHAKRVLWAVVRDYQNPSDDEEAVRTIAGSLWPVALTALGAAAPHVRIGVVPLNAQDIGLVTSASILDSSARAFQRKSCTVDVWLISPNIDDVQTMAVALRAPVVGLPERPVDPPPSPPPAPPPPAPDRAALRILPRMSSPRANAPGVFTKQNSPYARTLWLRGCEGVPAGCAGVVVRVQRGDRPIPMRYDCSPSEAFTELTLDGVPIKPNSKIPTTPGDHVLAWHGTGQPCRLFYGYTERAARAIATPESDDWRAVDYDDSAWPELPKASAVFTVPSGHACRFRFSIDPYSSDAPQ